MSHLELGTHDKAGEEVDELEGANAALSGQGPVCARADHEQRAHAQEAKDLDAQPPHHWVVHQGRGEVVPAWTQSAAQSNELALHGEKSVAQQYPATACAACTGMGTGLLQTKFLAWLWNLLRLQCLAPSPSSTSQHELLKKGT